MINRQQVFHISKDVLSQEIDKETVLLDMKQENYFGLNEVGSRALEILKEGANLDSLIITLLKEYDVEQKQLKADITELLQELLDEGLIKKEAS